MSSGKACLFNRFTYNYLHGIVRSPCFSFSERPLRRMNSIAGKFQFSHNGSSVMATLTTDQPTLIGGRAVQAGCRAGVFGIGLAAYWPQFPGLRDRLEGYQRIVEERLGKAGATVISAGLVDTAQAAAAAGAPIAPSHPGPLGFLA